VTSNVDAGAECCGHSAIDANPDHAPATTVAVPREAVRDTGN